MPSGDTAKRGRGCGRWIVRCGALCLALGFLLAVSVLTGIPQRLFAGLLVSSQLDARASVDAISLKDPLVARGLTLAGREASSYGPVLEIDRAEAAYRLRPENGRRIPSVALSGVRLSLQQDAEKNNFQFLLDRFAQPGGGGDVTPWLPERVNVDDLWLELSFPSFYLRTENLGLEAALEGADAGHAVFGAPAVALAWSSALAPGAQQRGAGVIEMAATWNEEGADIDAVLDLGLLVTMRGTASLTRRDGQPYYAISIPEASLQDPLWSAMLADITPIPVRFDRLAIKDSDVHFHIPAGGVAVDQARVDASINAFSVGPAEAPYYSGPLQLALSGNYGEKTEITGTITLRDTLVLEGAFQRSPEGLTGTFAWEPWSREDLLALTPPAYAPILDLLQPLQRLGAKGTLSHAPGAFTLDATLAAALGDQPPVNVPVSLVWGGAAGPAMLAFTAEAALGESRIKSKVTAPPGAPVTIESELAAVSPNAWTTRLLGRELLPGFVAALSGQANLVLAAGQPLAIDTNLTSAGLGYGALALPADAPVTIAGKMTWDSASVTLRGGALTLVQEGTADIRAEKWSFNTASAALEAGLSGTLSLDAIAALFALPDLHGEARIAGQLSAARARTALGEFTAESDSIGYGDWSVPYGSLLALAGSLAYDTAENTLRLEPIGATLGDGTRCSLASLALHFPSDAEPFRMSSAGLSLESDLEILEQRGTLAAATDARLRFTSENLGWTGASFAGLSTWELKAAEITLPEKMASIVNLTYAGAYDPGVNEPRAGRLTAEKFSVYDIPFGAVDTELKLTPEKLVCDLLETTFLAGTLALSGEIDYRDPAFHGSVKVRAEQLDLEQFTQTFKPPDVVMTGKVSGTADLILSTGGLQDLHVDMTASENLTLNQSAVRQILMQQYVNDAVGSKKIQEIIEKVIGKDEQRAFEKAVLTLRLEEGLIVGEARLESKALDVTVDIKAEPEAILQAIQSSTEGAPQNSQ